jgi:hypothetical protein
MIIGFVGLHSLILFHSLIRLVDQLLVVVSGMDARFGMFSGCLASGWLLDGSTGRWLAWLLD